MTAILKAKWSPACRERKDLGPMAWRRQGADIAIVGGPYTRDGKTVDLGREVRRREPLDRRDPKAK